SYGNFEIIVVTNSNLAHIGQTTFRDDKIKYVVYDHAYNFSDKCNRGVEKAKGEIIIILNDDVNPDHHDWISDLTEFLSIEGVGGVSPKLLYEDNTIQYAGMVT